jgi:hypothetical protein
MGAIESRGEAPAQGNPWTRARVSGGKTLGEMGISYDQSHRWQQLAAVPEDQFEAALAGPKPSTTGIIEAQTSARPSVRLPLRRSAPQHQQLDQLILGHAVHQALAGVGHIDLVLVPPKPWLPVARKRCQRKRCQEPFRRKERMSGTLSSWRKKGCQKPFSSCASTLSWRRLRMVGRKNSSSTVHLKRSTKPLVRGEFACSGP